MQQNIVHTQDPHTTFYAPELSKYGYKDIEQAALML